MVRPAVGEYAAYFLKIMDKVNIENEPRVIKAINEILSEGGIAEVKVERIGITVAEIHRQLKEPPRKTKM